MYVLIAEDRKGCAMLRIRVSLPRFMCLALPSEG